MTQEDNMQIAPLMKIISHDLRGPIGNLKSVMTLFRSGELEMEQAKMFMGQIEVGVDKSLNMLDNLIEWSQATTFPPKDTIELGDIIQTAYDLVLEDYEKKNIRFEIDLGGVSEVVWNKIAMRFIMRNLISNALKFTAENGLVSVSVARSEDKILISTIDEGIGIPEAMRSGIFAMSKDNRRIGTSGEKGTGIGLFLSKDLARRNNGKMWLEVNPSREGVIFHLEMDQK